jgi:hypothetical protein
MDEKGISPTVLSESEFSLERHDGTTHDQYDMRRVGKTQQLNVSVEGASQAVSESLSA